MTHDETMALSRAISQLPNEKLARVVEIIKERMPLLNEDDHEIEIDINALNVPTLRHLERYVGSCVEPSRSVTCGRCGGKRGVTGTTCSSCVVWQRSTHTVFTKDGQCWEQRTHIRFESDDESDDEAEGAAEAQRQPPAEGGRKGEGVGRGKGEGEKKRKAEAVEGLAVVETLSAKLDGCDAATPAPPPAPKFAPAGEFTASAKFEGGFTGYAFKTGAQGLGYYQRWHTESAPTKPAPKATGFTAAIAEKFGDPRPAAPKAASKAPPPAIVADNEGKAHIKALAQEALGRDMYQQACLKLDHIDGMVQSGAASVS